MNARLEDPAGFAKWDEATVVETHAPGHYRYSERTRLSFAGALAFRIERTWKESAYPEQVGKRIANFPTANGANRTPAELFGLWRAVWRDASVAPLRNTAIQLIAGYDGEAAKTCVINVLEDTTASIETRAAALRGLRWGRPSYAEEVARAVLLDSQADSEVVDIAAWVLEDHAGPQSYDALLRVAGDARRAPGARCAALRTLSRDPQPEHIPVMIAALAPSSPEKLHVCAMPWVLEYPFAQTRDAWHALPVSVAAPEAAKRAVFFLVRKGGPQDIEFVEQLKDNHSVPQELRDYARNTLRSKRWDNERREKARKRKEATP